MRMKKLQYLSEFHTHNIEQKKPDTNNMWYMIPFTSSKQKKLIYNVQTRMMVTKDTRRVLEMLVMFCVML